MSAMSFDSIADPRHSAAVVVWSKSGWQPSQATTPDWVCWPFTAAPCSAGDVSTGSDWKRGRGCFGDLDAECTSTGAVFAVFAVSCCPPSVFARGPVFVVAGPIDDSMLHTQL
eukprot:3531614-Prymnesium_polylepis.2